MISRFPRFLPALRNFHSPPVFDPKPQSPPAPQFTSDNSGSTPFTSFSSSPSVDSLLKLAQAREAERAQLELRLKELDLFIQAEQEREKEQTFARKLGRFAAGPGLKLLLFMSCMASFSVSVRLTFLKRSHQDSMESISRKLSQEKEKIDKIKEDQLKFIEIIKKFRENNQTKNNQKNKEEFILNSLEIPFQENQGELL